MKRSNNKPAPFLFGAFALVMVFFFAPTASASEITSEKVVELVNQDRQDHGVESLRMNEALTRAAQAKADDMAKNEYFAHTSPSGVTPWYWIQESGYDYRSAGENLAIHFMDAEEQEKAWMESVKHRENILSSKYQDIGVAVEHIVQNGQPTIIVVQMFGLPSGVVLAPKTAAEAVAPLNKMVEGVSSTVKNPAPLSAPLAGLSYRSAEKTDYFETAVRIMTVLSMVMTALMAGWAIMIMILNRRAIALKWFRKEQVLHSRG